MSSFLRDNRALPKSRGRRKRLPRETQAGSILPLLLAGYFAVPVIMLITRRW
jgi:hypothetical protein